MNDSTPSLVSHLGIQSTGLKKKTYLNPIIDEDFPDPSIIKAKDGYYYCYATQLHGNEKVRSINIRCARSHDLVSWEILSDAMPIKPHWARGTQDFWAPDVVEANGLYYMYYSSSIQGYRIGATQVGKGMMGIGVAVSPVPTGPFIDSGKPLVVGPWIENIDPNYFKDPVTGQRFLYWGSGFKAIKVRELAANMLDFKQGSKPIPVLYPDNTMKNEALIEAPFVIYRNGYYYMFYSGECCWEDERYCVMVARSLSPKGPFVKKAAQQGRGESIILGHGKRWKGPGHNGIITDDEGNDWMLYHAIDSRNRKIKGTGDLRRPLLMDKIYYDKDGWPLILGHTPSEINQISPVIQTPQKAVKRKVSVRKKMRTL